jgi:hypothetical protein
MQTTEITTGTEIIDLDGRQWTVMKIVEFKGSRWYEVRNDRGTAVRYDSDIAGVELK